MERTRRGRRGLAAGLLAVLLPWLGGCVTVAEFRKLEDQVVRLRKEEGPAADRARLADLSVELADLRTQLEELRGRVEVGEHLAQRALEEAESARREIAQASGGASLPAASDPDAAGAVRMKQPGLTGESNGSPVGPVAGPLAGAGPGPGAGQAARRELEDYRLAYDAWRTDDTSACVDRFREFLQTYPSSSYADAAAYWMADCYFKQGEFQTAILRFDDVASRYPESDKAPEALYRQGEALLRLGPSYGGAAKKAFERVIQEYPGSRRARDAEQQVRLLESR